MLLDFPSIRGNQEERITLVLDADNPTTHWIAELPETFRIGEALVIHGHQWPYNEKTPATITKDERLIIHGHTHVSALTIGGSNKPIQYGQPITLPNELVIVNVGSVVDHKEWALYDADAHTITFMKVD